MKKYDYNETFFGHWLESHPEITKRDILTVIENKDYGSLKRWADGAIMPTHTILRLCNHYGIDIWNFFRGMPAITDKADKKDTMSDTDVNVLQSPGADVDITTNITPDINVKKAQWEARYQKDLHMKEIEHQRQMDALRKEYEDRLDSQRREMMATINKQIEHIMYMSNISSGMGYGAGIASDVRGASSVPNVHPGK